MKPSTSSLDRLPKAISEKWEADRQLFEDELRSEDLIPREAVAIGVSLDGVMVPLKDGDAAKEGGAGDEESPEGATGYKEASCGTVSLYDADGNRLQTIRYGRMPEHKKATLKSELEAEVKSIVEARAGDRCVRET